MRATPIIRVTSTAICGSDLHLYDGYIPTMMTGDILGHEFMGEVVEVGSGVQTLKVGDRVVNPFPIACGSVFLLPGERALAVRELQSQCVDGGEDVGPFAGRAVRLFAHARRLRGRSGRIRAHSVRGRRADQGAGAAATTTRCCSCRTSSPRATWRAENCNIKPGDTVAVWGCGPVGLFAVASAFILGAERVIAIDRIPERLRQGARALQGRNAQLRGGQRARRRCSEMTGGRGPDCLHRCRRARGARPRLLRDVRQGEAGDAHGVPDRPTALREAILACRNGGTLSVPGVYGGFLDKVPFGAIVNKALTVKTGQTHVQRYLQPLLELIEQGRIDPSFIISHHLPLEEAPRGFQMFRRQAGRVHEGRPEARHEARDTA